MPKLAVRLTVSMAIAVIVMTGIQALRVWHPYAAFAETTSGEAAGDVEAVPRFAPARPWVDDQPRRPTRRPSLGMARIHGRVVADNGTLDDLHVAIEGPENDYEPRLGDDGSFDINLPAGTYGVEASDDGRVAFAEVSDLLPSEDREIILRLAPGVAITGRVDGCGGPCPRASVTTQVRGRERDVASDNTADDGAFILEGLIPGRAYDVVVEYPDMRLLVVRGVRAPTANLLLTLEPAAHLRGGFGVGPDEDCPMETISMEAPGDDGAIDQSHFDRHCRFHFDALPDAESVHITADGTGWHFDLDVLLPAHGNPPFLCLRPPCRDPQSEPKAQLVIDGLNERNGSATIVFRYPNHERVVRGCGSSPPCRVGNLAIGLKVSLLVGVEGCDSQLLDVDLHPGENHVAFRCDEVRAIQGVMRGIGPMRGRDVQVRCSRDSDETERVRGRFFGLKCPARLGSIEFQAGENEPWRSVPITVEGEDGFVELNVDG